jgi:hypothetical protein
MPYNSLAPAPVNALSMFAPESRSNANPYIDSLMRKALQDYPFLSQHKPVVITNPNKDEGFAQTYSAEETGRPLGDGTFSRPKELPMGQLGIEIYRPNEFTHHDLVGEVLHVDPFAREISDKLATTFDPRQLELLKREALDYGATIKEGRPEADAIRNATDSAVRGYVVGQWPEEVNQEFGYSPVQKALLESLKNYTKTGKR